MRAVHRTACDTYELGSRKLYVQSKHNPNVLLVMFYTYIQPSLMFNIIRGLFMSFPDLKFLIFLHLILQYFFHLISLGFRRERERESKLTVSSQAHACKYAR